MVSAAVRERVSPHRRNKRRKKEKRERKREKSDGAATRANKIRYVVKGSGCSAPPFVTNRCCRRRRRCCCCCCCCCCVHARRDPRYVLTPSYTRRETTRSSSLSAPFSWPRRTLATKPGRNVYRDSERFGASGKTIDGGGRRRSGRRGKGRILGEEERRGQ